MSEGWFQRLGGLTPIDANLHRCPIPWTPDDFRALHAAGVRVVFSLEESVPWTLGEAAGLEVRRHFWTDDVPPTRLEMETFLAELRRVPDSVGVAIHCRAGWGRTGSALACALVERRGWSSRTALAHVWARVPPAERVMRRNGQADFVHGWAAARAERGLDL